MTQAHPSPGLSAGYTLMELLVVVAILGLLAGIAAPEMERYFAHGQESAAETKIANLVASLRLFRSDTGRFPTNAEGLNALLAAPPGTENWDGPYVRSTAALDDPWGHRFIYRAPGEHGEFDLFSRGPVAAAKASKLHGPVQ